MSKQIYAALPEDVIRRMRNWALYDAGGYGLATSGGGCSIYDLGVDVDRYRQSSVVVLCGEAEDTKAAMDALPARYGDAVKQFWRYEGRSLRWHGRHRGINHETFEIWVMKGHDLLRAELARQTEAWRRRSAAAAQVQFGGA